MEHNSVSTPKAKTNTLAVVGFILAFIVPFVGFILSIISLNQIKKKNEGGKGLAISGIVISIVFMVVLPIILLIVFLSVPALQKNQRNVARSSDASIFMSMVVECLSNNSGQINYCNTHSDIPFSGNGAVLTNWTYGDGTGSNDELMWAFGRKCDGGMSIVDTSGQRNFSVTYQSESSSNDFVNICIES